MWGWWLLCFCRRATRPCLIEESPMVVYCLCMIMMHSEAKRVALPKSLLMERERRGKASFAFFLQQRFDPALTAYGLAP